MSPSSSYGRTAVLLTEVIGQELDSVVLLAGSSITIASLGWSDLSVTGLSDVGSCSGCGATTFGVVKHDLNFWWTHLATSFQVVLLQVYSACCSMNGSTTCFASSDVSPVFSLSQCASLDCSMSSLSGGHFLGAHSHMNL